MSFVLIEIAQPRRRAVVEAPSVRATQKCVGNRCVRVQRMREVGYSDVVAAVPVPVTLKIRTGYSRAERNAVRIARIAEDSGVAAIAVHGRTREDFFTGDAEYDSAAAVKSAVR